MRGNRQAILDAIAQDIWQLTQVLMDENDLQNSSLKETMQVKVSDLNNPVIDLFFDDYLTHIEQGRKPRSGKMPPISALRDWALRHNIPADNQTLWAIANAIWEKGYAPRPILARIEEQIEARFNEDWADWLLDAIDEEIEAIFNK